MSSIRALGQRYDLQSKARQQSKKCNASCCARGRDCHAESLIPKLNVKYVVETPQHYNSTSPSGMGLPNGSYDACSIAARQSKEALNVARAVECRGSKLCESYKFDRLVRSYGAGACECHSCQAQAH